MIPDSSGPAGTMTLGYAPPPADGNMRDVPSDPRERDAERLRQLAAQMEAFLSRQIDRLEHELARPAAGSSTHDVERFQAELAAAREHWEQERLEEEQRLREDADRLTEAWARLEVEQRELLKAKMQGRTASVGPPPATGRAPTTGSRAPSNDAAPSPFTANSPERGAASQRNQQQFQQLRREMLEHARQGRKR